MMFCIQLDMLLISFEKILRYIDYRINIIFQRISQSSHGIRMEILQSVSLIPFFDQGFMILKDAFYVDH